MFFKRDKNKVPHGSSLAEALKDARKASSIILASIDDGVILIDAAGAIQSFNPAAEKITGWSAADAHKLDHHSVLRLVNDRGEPYSNDINPVDKSFIVKTPVRDNTASLKTHSDKLLSVDVSISPLLDDTGALKGVVAVFRDVSEERQEEKQRAEFISTASHEMRTPVAAIEGYLALALNEKVAQIDAKARDYLEKAHASTAHLGRLFQDLLTAAKSEDGRLSSHPVAMEMGQFLENLVNDIRFTAEKKGLKLDYLIGAGSDSVNATTNTQKVIRPLYYVHADPDRLREVVTNLFDNAVKYTEQGKITIGLTGDQKIVQFRITDEGQGIPAEDISHLFQKFYRVDNSATRTIGGTGLGLFISRKIIELYGGHIWVESVLGQGSTFFFNLPRLSSEDVQRLKLNEPGLPPAATGGVIQ